ncbi:MAG: M20 family metallo-hydrolase [Chloroflexota bacterium]|nr:M20 family metallo-hydrolase [Chloroflexota bacterium]
MDEEPRIDAAWLHGRLAELAQIGATPGGGVTRLALSDEDRAGRDLLQAWMEDAGLAVRVDDLGNMVGRREGREPVAPVLLGSHIDSVRRGGRFDGPLGVLGALAAVRALNTAGIGTRRPIEVVNWTNEEGVRFEPAMLASGVVSGRFDRAYAYDRAARDGLRFEDELRRIGYLGREEDRPGQAAAYLELHVEQGPVLEDAGVPVGVVEGIVGITWLNVTVEGQADHAGPSPMRLRRDALVAASRLVAAVDRLARETDEVAVGTVGRLVPEPNVINTVPGRVVMSADFRHPGPATLDGMVDRFREEAEQVSAESGVSVTVDRFWTSEATPFDARVVGEIAAACQALGLPEHRLWSGAGHDAKYLADRGPAGMIFVRSRGGLSHCEEEFSEPGDIEAGANVLLLAALRLAAG